MENDSVIYLNDAVIYINDAVVYRQSIPPSNPSN